MGAQCCKIFVNNKKLLINEINDFFRNMNHVKIEHENITKQLKIKWKKNGINQESFEIIIQKLLINSNLNKNIYHDFWIKVYNHVINKTEFQNNIHEEFNGTQTYFNTNISNIIYSMLILCKKNTISLKQNISSLALGIFKQSNIFIKSKDGLKINVDKLFVKKLLFEYISIITAYPLKFGLQFELNNSPDKDYLINKVFSYENINDFIDNILLKYSKDCDYKKQNINNIKNSIDDNYELISTKDQYIDFDFVFDTLYNKYLFNNENLRNLIFNKYNFN